MEPDEAEDVRMLLEYDEYTAGGMMTPEPVILAPDSTVAEALARIRNSDLPPALAAQVYVCRPPLEVPTGRYLGLGPLPAAAARDARRAGHRGGRLRARAGHPGVHRCTRSPTCWPSYNLVAIPVVDDNDRLLGAVTVDDVIDHMLPDDWRNQDAHEPAGCTRWRVS